MGHRRRVEAFLREMGKEDDYIQSVLDEIPEKEPKPRRQARGLCILIDTARKNRFKP